MRLLLAILTLLLLPIRAEAMLLHGGGTSVSGCVAPLGCTVTASGFNWTWGSLVTGNARYVNQYHMLANGGGAFEFGDIMGNSAGNLTWRTTTTGCGSMWESLTIGFVSGFPGGTPLNDFIDTTIGHGSAAFAGISGAITSAGVNGTVSVQPSPAGTCWPFGENDFKSGQTINLAAGVHYAAGFDIGGNSTNQNNVSIIGDSGTPAIFDTELRVRDASLTPTFEYVQVKSFNGAACGASTGSGILTGQDGVVTLLHVLVNGCGSGGAGQDHNVYISSPATNDATGSAQITDLTSTNVVGGGWTLKMRPTGTNLQNHLTQSVIGCTISGDNSCQVNGALDMPCGGDYKIDFNTIERGQCSNISNCAGYLMRALEENRDGAQCAVAFAPTNQAIIDHNNLIWDGASPGWSTTNVLCLAQHTGGAVCATGGLPGGGYTYTLTNNVIVSDSASSVVLVPGGGVGAGAGCTLVAGKCTDANNNRWYDNRTTAASNEGWSGTDQFGNPCCAFPWLPAHP